MADDFTPRSRLKERLERRQGAFAAFAGKRLTWYADNPDLFKAFRGLPEKEKFNLFFSAFQASIAAGKLHELERAGLFKVEWLDAIADGRMTVHHKTISGSAE